MAALWITEIIPFAVTAMFPLIVFPVAGIAGVPATFSPYAHPILLLFFGGILIALAMERWNLHRRIALHVVAFMGPRQDSIVAGFLVASAFLSMWINNTATAVMMLPIGLSVVALVEGKSGAVRCIGFAPSVLLAIAYGANIGGFVTLIGTAPNAIFAGFVSENYGVEIGFARWMMFAGPVALLTLPACWFVLTRVVFKLDRRRSPGTEELLRSELADLGPLQGAEKSVLVVFSLTAILWIIRPWLPLENVSDTTIALCGGLSLFMIPAGRKGTECVMDWKTATKAPWDVLILIGGGLSLAGAVQDTGLASAIGGVTRHLGDLPPLALIGFVATLMLALTELTSNTATTAAFLPVVGSAAVGLGANPILLCAVATIAASGAFMLPVATPPNAIVFSSGRVTIGEMIKAGIALNIVLIFSLVILASLAGPFFLGSPPGLETR